MAAIKTHTFLPEIFRTDANKKFLNATVDQLINEPNFTRINGYIGRKFAPTFKSSDSYLSEIDDQRQNYQLEPSVVVINPDTNDVDSYSNYPDLINKIKFWGGNVDNHSRLFENELYSYDGKFDFDKFVNFSQYYWLPNGPDSVLVSASGIPLEKTFTVNLNSESGTYYFTDNSKNTGNESIVLARGGVYTFKLDNTTDPFWIQSKNSANGQDPSRPNIGVRSVFGVTNNGATSGSVTFIVPQSNAQTVYTNMPLAASVDFATSLSYRDIQGNTVDNINTMFAGLDGVTGTLDGKKIIFVGPEIDDYFWTSALTDNAVVANADRTKTWIINTNGGVVTLAPLDTVGLNEQVYVKSGVTNATKNYYVDYHARFVEMPSITAGLDTLYFQNGSLATASGLIQIVDPAAIQLDPANEIVGKQNYTSPTGIIFTNGLKVTFDTSAIGGYADKTYYVEGVGESIVLVPTSDLIAVEAWGNSYTIIGGSGYQVDDILTVNGGTGSPAKLTVESVDESGSINSFSVLYAGDYSVLPTNPVTVTGGNGTNASLWLELQPLTKDYLTINRSSIDINAWSRSNRWFHIDVIKSTAAYNGTEFAIDQNYTAIRPIIEFEPNIKLFNYGAVAKAPINVLDTLVTNAYQQIENIGATTFDSFIIDIGGKTLKLHDGDRVVFSNDVNEKVRSKIYTFNIVDVSENTNPVYIGTIVETGENISSGVNLLVTRGGSQGVEYYYDGTQWLVAQQKTGINQAPRYDMFDENEISFGDTSTYVNSTFTGTTIFEYKAGTGKTDTELGFPLSYRTFNNVGDIQFNNSYDTDTFTYLMNPQTLTQAINVGFLHVTKDLDNYSHSNIWTTVVEKSKQYQIISHNADGVNNLFEIDILPNPTNTVPNIKVFLNSKIITVENFGLSQIGARYAVLVNPSLLTAGDAVDILIYSNSVSDMGYYQVPPSLDNNAENITFDSLTLGQIRNHLITINQNSVNVSGVIPGNSNIRDLRLKKQGGSIVKHSSSTIYSQMSLTDSTLNAIDSIKLAQKEYSKFKNKFLELAAQMHLDNGFDVAEVTDSILKTINGIKNSNFPWYYSDMVPYGDNKRTLPSYTVLDPRIRSYELSAIFDDTKLSNTAVLVYLTRTVDNVTTKRLLVKDTDYTFNKTNPSFTISDKFNLNYRDILTVVEYFDTDGNYIPETPTKLGLHPKYIPSKYIDDTYLSPTYVIQGHDGSITPAFNDYRDDLLLELELRIYDNIKIAYSGDVMAQHIPGKFRVTDYSATEFNQVLTNNFLTWIGSNRLDYTTNSYFDQTNPWTYNYKNFKDSINAEQLPGTWRAVFKWFYDTDRPHTCPWEMLGFSAQPDWWEDRYGPAPYTGGNLNLWSDLSIGYIHAGPRAGLDARYARPGLLQIIPVDDAGKLRSPDQFATINFNVGKANASFSVGNQGPVETAWRRSSDYAFALQIALALTKPGLYFGLFSNVDVYKFNTKVNQYLDSSNNQHLSLPQIVLNGFDDGSGNVSRAAGYVNWMSDFVTNTGVTQSRYYIAALLNNLSVKLSYKAAGFIDKGYLKVLAEQGSPSSTNDSIVIPDENYHIYMNKSIPIDRITYSAVIVEKTDAGYSVSGYAIDNPYFTIVPSLANNNAYSITVGKVNGTVYKDYQKVLVKIPYGHEFSTTQQVVDFLVGYQRYLQSRGFIFVDTDPNMNTKKDWILSAKEFLTWAQQGWNSGNILVLSPVNDKLSVSTTNSVVDEINGPFNSSKLLDPNFTVIKPSSYTVMREDNNFSVTSIKGQTICLAELNLVQYEHVLVFDNKTVFNDIIYSPDTGNRQYRLKLVGHKTADWTGAMNPPGFIYNNKAVDAWQSGIDYRKGQLVVYKNIYYTALNNIAASSTFDQTQWKQINQSQIKTGLLPNFALNAGVFENIYDIDNPAANENFNFYSSGITGFRERSYLTDLGIDTDTQTKFYQGYIKQKGTKGAISALAQAQLANINSEINVYEEWALRVGEYGATDSNKFIDVELNESSVTANPIALQFVDDASLAQDGALVYTPIDYYKSNGDVTTSLFTEYQESSDKPKLPTAGYVNVDDVDATIFDLANYRDLTSILNDIGTGYKIWTAKDFYGQWNVFRASETEVMARSLTYNIDNVASFATNVPHGFMQGDIIAVKGFNTTYDGFYQVYDVIDTQTFNVVLAKNFTQLRDAGTLYGYGMLFKLTSCKIDTPDMVDGITPKFGWVNNDKVWVDSIDSSGNWGVYNKTSPWNYKMKIQLNSSEYQSDSNFGSSIKVSPDGTAMFVGAAGSGRAAVFIKTNQSWIENGSLTDITWVQNGSLSIAAVHADEFGHAIDSNDHSFVVAAPGSNSNQGYVFLYTIDESKSISIGQILVAPSPSSNNRFGQSISCSNDGAWLYVGEPGSDKVHVYSWTTIPTNYTQEIASGTTTTALTHTPTNAMHILVNGSRPYIPGVEYTVVGSNITFTPALTEKVVVTTQSHYELYTSITEPNGLTGVNFGIDVKANPDGTQLIIGSNLVSNGQGAAYVFDRSVEKFIASGSNNTFTVSTDFSSVYSVLIDGVKTTAYTVYNRSVSLSTIPESGSVVQIETNSFILVQKLTSLAANDNQKMGSSVDICKNTCSVYVAAPYYKTINYQSGAVYRYVNQGRLYGTVVGTTQNPTVTVGNSIRINGSVVTFNYGTSLDSVVGAINQANITGISASNYNGYLKVESTSLAYLNKLEILPNVGTAFSDLGLAVFVQSQIIKHPSYVGTEQFGTSIKISDDALSLAVGSLGASTTETTTFDNQTTVFDTSSMHLRDHIANSGAVYMYNLMSNPYETAANPSQMVFVQELLPAGLGANFNFGASMDFNDGLIYVGATNDNSIVDGGGSVYEFLNNTPSGGWELLHYKKPQVDNDSLNRAFVYNKKTQTILAHLQVYDPVKGRILGVVDQDLDFKSEYDPAVYNNGFLNYNPTYHWTNQQVGKTWWDLSQVRFVEYEQDNILYKNKHWGSTFNGSTFAVYEWVESSVLPSQYVANGGNGVPKHSDDSNYVSYTYVDSATGVIKSSYYFWVSGKTTVDPATGRTNSVLTLQQILQNPKEQDIPYIAIMEKNAVGLYNVHQYLTSKDVVLHMDFSSITSSNIIHSEYELLKEGSNDTELPTRIVNKLRDSLSGMDEMGLMVPDPKLKDSEKYGIGIRPRQAMFVNRIAALENFVKYVNDVFVLHPMADQFNISTLNQGEPIPPSSIGEWDIEVSTKQELGYISTASLADGYKVLVDSDVDHDGLWVIYRWNTASSAWTIARIQSYLTKLYYSLVDWYASDFDYTVAPTYTVARYIDIKKLSLVEGDIIKVTDNGDARFAYYRVASDLSLDRVGSQNGTLQLSPALYDLAAGNMGFDNDSFDTIRFDQTPSIETRYIFSTVHEDLLIKDLRVDFNNMFFGLVNYIYSEQVAPDWIFKTSFISVLHRIRELAQYPSYIKDNQTFYEDYINEVKPFRTTIREYVPSQSGIDYLHAGATDFDLPAYYDPVTGTYRQPNGELPTDANLLLTSDYIDWSSNYQYKVTEINIDKGGSGFTFVPNISIIGGGGTGATAIANITNGSISSVYITNPGVGYTSTPTILVNGNGTGASLVPVLKNEYYSSDITQSYNTSRNISSSIKFDRVAYTSPVVQWEPHTAYDANVMSGFGTGNVWLNSGNLVSYNNEVYVPISANVTTEATFDGDLYTKLNSGNVLLNTNDRIMGYYSPTVGMTGKDIGQLVDGVAYTGTNVVGDGFTRSESIVDSTITSSYIDSTLGTRPEDINVDGGAYVDEYSSHAPQELIPGIVYDTLSMHVMTAYTTSFSSNGFYIDRVTLTNPGFGYSYDDIQVQAVGAINSYLTPTLHANGAIKSITIVNKGTGITGTENPTILITGANVVPATASAYVGQNMYSLLGYREFHGMRGSLEYTRTSSTTQLATDLNITDTVINVVNASVLQEPSPELAVPGVIFVNGERITYYTIDYVANTLGQIRRATDGTGAPMVHASGSTVIEAGRAQVVPGTSSEIPSSIESFTGDGTTKTFTCATIAANVKAYADSITATVNGQPYPFIVVQTTPVIEITFDSAPPTGSDIAIGVQVEKLWLNPPVAAVVSMNFVTNTGDTLITNSGDELVTAPILGSTITDGSGLVGSTTAQAKFLKGTL